MDWYRWHEGYAEPGALGARLESVQAEINASLTETPSGRIRLISMCAGQGHDVIGSLPGSRRRDDVCALLVELDERNVEVAQQRIAAATLADIVTIKTGDGGVTDVYQEMVPANVILVCGVFGSLTDHDIDRTVGTLPSLAAPGGHVIWTANRSQGPELWETVLASFARHGFAQVPSGDDAERIGVGRHRLVADPVAFQRSRRMFTFADEETLIRIGRVRRC